MDDATLEATLLVTDDAAEDAELATEEATDDAELALLTLETELLLETELALELEPPPGHPDERAATSEALSARL